MNFNTIKNNEVINQVFNGIKEVYVDGKLCKQDEAIQKEILDLFFKLETELDTEEEVTYEIVKYIVENHSDKINYEIVEILRLKNEYEKADDKIKFLIENNFKGVEKLETYERKDDKYGHQIVKIGRPDFTEKVVKVVIGSSDD